LAQPFAWVRVWPAQDWHRSLAVPPEPRWLLIEEQPGGELKYALSNLPARTTLVQAVRLWKQRWQVEQGHQHLKEELGLDHFEGRSWRGFHHHACLVLLAYGFLKLERAQQRSAAERSEKKGMASRR
jgi:SRSO17 transposase